MSLQNSSNNIISSAPMPSSPPMPSSGPPPLPPRPLPESVSSPVPSSAPPNYVPPATPTAASASSSFINPGLVDDVYSGAASYGIFRALLSAIGGTIIGILLIWLGVYIVKLPDKTSIQGIITQVNGATGPSATCPYSLINKSISYSCQYTVEYVYQGQKYTQNLSYNGPTPYSIGQPITVYVISDNPQDASFSQGAPSGIGWALIVFGAFVIGGGWFMYWASKKWKIVAAAQGAQGIASMFSGGGNSPGPSYGGGYGGGGYGGGYGGYGGGAEMIMGHPLDNVKLF